MKPWDCRHLLCFMHLLTLLFVRPVCTNMFVRDRSLTEEVVIVTCVRYSYKALKTSKINSIIILMQRDELTPYGDHRLQRINAG